MLTCDTNRKRAVTAATPIYKIVSKTEWDDACRGGVFDGASVDRADGFIHLSAAHQVRETAAKHFDGRRDLLLVAFDPASLGDALRWEVSRGGDRFPHLYAPLTTALALWAKPLPLTAEGAHAWTGLLA